MYRLLMVIHLVTLGVWAGVLVTAGAAAAVIFPTAKGLDATAKILPAETPDQWRLVGGRIANSVFLAADTAQLVLAGIAVLSVVALGLNKFLRAGIGLAVWMIALAGAVMSVAYHLLVLQPRMGTNLGKYWTAAQEGRTNDAVMFREAFSADHPTATTVMVVITSLVLVSLVGALVSALPREPKE
jgi:hypothetical protein